MALLDFLRIPAPKPQRTIDLETGQRFGTDLLALDRSTATSRRSQRTNADITETYAAVYAAVRWRSQAITAPEIVLQRQQAGEWVDIGTIDQPEAHPALAVMHRVNAGLTFRHGFGLIEQHKLTYGSAYWVKRRNGLRVPMEFEIWSPPQVEIISNKERSWEVDAYKLHRSLGQVVTVPSSEVIPFRHIIHPANPLWSMSPITAIRLEAEGMLEAQRYNLRFFDQGMAPGGILTADDIEASEARRIETEMARHYQGTDNAHRWWVVEGALKPVIPQMSQKDMEFIAAQQWTVQDVARVFELSPLALKDFTRATYENASQANAADWAMIVNQLEATLEEFTEFMLWPDFGRDLRLVARTDNIKALQEDQKVRAEIDNIRLAAATTTVNELRHRDGLDAVAWGDVPLIPITLKPLGYEPPPPVFPPQNGPPKNGSEMPMDDMPRARIVSGSVATEGEPGLLAAERRMDAGWGNRLRTEMRAIIKHLEARAGEDGRKRALELGDVDSYAWDWRRYLPVIIGELEAAFLEVLQESGFVSTPILGAQQYAERWASRRAGELISLRDRASVIAYTRERVRTLVAETIAEGKSLRELKNALRGEFAFSASRAEAIARTETATAIGQGRRASAMTQGQDEKRWVTAGDDSVDANAAGQPCRDNEAAGWMPLTQGFPSGHDTIPAHPRCRCDVEYRTGRLQ